MKEEHLQQQLEKPLIEDGKMLDEEVIKRIEEESVWSAKEEMQVEGLRKFIEI